MDIERLAAQNPWWADRTAIEADEKVRRVLETGERIAPALKEESQALIGPRQLGKTTALKYDIYRKITREHVDPKRILYYSFDTARSFGEISDVINTFVLDGSAKLFMYLDEVGFVDGWQRAIKSFLDSSRSSNAVTYITGSSSINLKKELMPGRRIKFYEFSPLTFRGFLLSMGSKSLKQSLKEQANDLGAAIRMAKGMAAHFEEVSKWFGIYMHTGGYPDAIFDYLDNKKTSEALYDTHWNAFVSDVSRAGKSVEIATAVVYGILESYSSKVNLSKIARMQGIKSHVTVREYIEMLEELFAARSVFPMAGRKYVFRKERKIYFNDPFLYSLFAKKANMVDKGAESKIVEGIVYNHIYRFVNEGKQIAEPKTSLGFNSGRREVDFVSGDFGFEVKWQNEAAAEDFPDIGIKNRVLLSKKTMDYDESGTTIVPLPLFLAML